MEIFSICYFSTVRTENSLRNVFESISGVMREKYRKRERHSRIRDLKDAARILFRFEELWATNRRDVAASATASRRLSYEIWTKTQRAAHHVYPPSAPFWLGRATRVNANLKAVTRPAMMKHMVKPASALG